MKTVKEMREVMEASEKPVVISMLDKEPPWNEVKPKLQRVNAPSTCGNCDNLRWGQDQGFDWCCLHRMGIQWATKWGQVCPDHKLTSRKDPRNRDDLDVLSKEEPKENAS